MTDLLSLLEQRVSRLERIVGNATPGQSADGLVTQKIIYHMTDARLILSGGYDVESDTTGSRFRWFGNGENAQMLFPHAGISAQHVRLVLKRYPGVDMSQVRIVANEASMPLRLTNEGAFENADFTLPPQHHHGTEIHMVGIQSVCPSVIGKGNDARNLSFRLFRAEFSRVPDGEA
jgi:hypothetical protein